MLLTKGRNKFFNVSYLQKKSITIDTLYLVNYYFSCVGLNSLCRHDVKT